MNNLINNSSRSSYAFWINSRAFGFWLQFVSSFYSCCGIFVLIAVTTGNPNLFGQALTYLIVLGDYVQWPMRQLVTLEINLTSVERIL
jgi:ATP-binding cassette subfamily C (CFTR/MRP) protein 4